MADAPTLAAALVRAVTVRVVATRAVAPKKLKKEVTPEQRAAETAKRADRRRRGK